MTMNISDGWRPYKGQLDYYGNKIEDRIYNNRDFDYSIILAAGIRMWSCLWREWCGFAYRSVFVGTRTREVHCPISPWVLFWCPAAWEDFQKAENSNDPVVKYYKRYAIIAVWDQHADFCCKAIRLVFRAIHHKVEQFSVYLIWLFWNQTVHGKRIGCVHITWDIADLDLLGNELHGYIIADGIDRHCWILPDLPDNAVEEALIQPLPWTHRMYGVFCRLITVERPAADTRMHGEIVGTDNVPEHAVEMCQWMDWTDIKPVQPRLLESAPLAFNLRFIM